MSLLPLDAVARALAEADPLPVTGTVVRATGLVLEASLPRVPGGTACEIAAADGASVMAEVVGFFGQTARLMPLAEIHGIGEGCTVIPRTAGDTVPVGEALLGRVDGRLETRFGELRRAVDSARGEGA